MSAYYSPYEGRQAPAFNRDAEGLQVVPHGTYPYVTKESYNNFSAHENEGKQVIYDDAGLIPIKDDKKKRRKRRICDLSKRTWLIVGITGAILIVCVAVAAGIGVYYAHKSKRPTRTKDSFNAVAATATATIPTATSGTTGFAEAPCEAATVSPPTAPQAKPLNVSNPYKTIGASFDITCSRRPALSGANHVPLHNIGQFIEYNFTSCMLRCADNMKCKGVVYGANLTEMVEDGEPGGNCLLKNGSWVASRPADIWYASAVRL